LTDLLCVPSVLRLERRFVGLCAKAEAAGAKMEEIFRFFDRNNDGAISGPEMEEGLRKIEGMQVRRRRRSGSRNKNDGDGLIKNKHSSFSSSSSLFLRTFGLPRSACW